MKLIVRLNRVGNHFRVLYISDITEGNEKRIKISIFNGLQDFTTKSKYGWRQKEPAKKDYRIQKTTMNRLSLDKFIPYTLDNWSQKSYNTEIWTFDVKIKK